MCGDRTTSKGTCARIVEKNPREVGWAPRAKDRKSARRHRKSGGNNKKKKKKKKMGGLNPVGPSTFVKGGGGDQTCKRQQGGAEGQCPTRVS